jgi:hypothetical protein
MKKKPPSKTRLPNSKTIACATALLAMGVLYVLDIVIRMPPLNDTDHRPPPETGAGSESSVQSTRCVQTETRGGGSRASDG